ncbi:unnamed protein product [Cylicocyclus nassatus]|uniref:PARG catalytic Macro domain-containing protein n=1 Tax=Cylicocyclus nassatus TaxID=53992 RepID=A0AA36ME41_CYLNA|nr:unnamed protein product [Cylicocyclus nassatus]
MSTNNKQPIVVHNNGCSVLSELVEAVRIRAFRNEQTIPSYWSNDSDEVGARTYTQDVIGSNVTGFWECGVSRYDKELRSLIQILAAAKAGRDMIYICDFYDVKYGSALVNLYDLLIQRKITVGALYKALISYEAYHSLMNSPTSSSLPGSANQKISVFNYITNYMTISSEIQKSQTA